MNIIGAMNKMGLQNHLLKGVFSRALSDENNHLP